MISAPSKQWSVDRLLSDLVLGVNHFEPLLAEHSLEHSGYMLV